MADHFFDYSCISLFMGFLQDDIRSALYEAPARALSGLSKGLVRPCPGIQSALYMALCESVQGLIWVLGGPLRVFKGSLNVLVRAL